MDNQHFFAHFDYAQCDKNSCIVAQCDKKRVRAFLLNIYFFHLSRIIYRSFVILSGEVYAELHRSEGFTIVFIILNTEVYALLK